MTRILITGTKSFLGQALTQWLSQWPEKYFIDTITLRNDAWKSESFKNFDVIFHVAGIAHDATKKISRDEKDLYYKVNARLAFQTAQKAKFEGVKQFIFLSSSIVYGASAPIGKNKIITRDTETNPESYYGDSKVQAEILLKKLDDENFSVCILRCPMIYGAGCKGNYTALSKFARRLPIFPKVKNSRSMLYVKNFAEFVRLMIDDKTRGIFWPQNEKYSNTSEIVKMIAEAHRKKIMLVPFCGLPLKMLAKFSPLVNKAFGSLVYDMSLSEYEKNYRLYDLRTSINETEITS